MAHRVEAFETICGPGVSVSEDFPFEGGQGEVVRIKVWFPRGCNLLVRSRVRYAGSQVIPYDINKAMKGNGRWFDFTIEGYPVGDAWSMGVANDDVYTHTIQTLFYIEELTTSGDQSLPPVILLPFSEV